MILKATTETIKVITSTGADVDYFVSYADLTTEANDSTSFGKITTATTTTILAAPSASTQRMVLTLSLVNIEAGTDTNVTIYIDDTSSTYRVWKGDILRGEKLEYVKGEGWKRYNAEGKLIYIGDTGATGAGVPTGGTTGEVLAKIDGTDYNTEWVAPGGYTDEQAQDAVGGLLYDSSEIDFTYDDAIPRITATIVTGSIDESKLDASVNASLDLADSALQSAALTPYFNKSVDDTDDITVGATNKFATAAEKTKLGYITVTQSVDLDAIETRVNDLDAAVVLKGTWSASGGTFPGSGVAQAGWSYLVTADGTVDGIEFKNGDRVIAILDNASTTVYASNWYKADYTDRVSTVAGRTGAVVIVAADLADFNTAALTAAPAETTTTAGALINGATSKSTPVDADYVGLMDSAASNILKKLSWANIKATAKTYFDTIYILRSEVPVCIQLACSDLSTVITAGTSKAYVRSPYSFTLSAVRASLLTSQTGGSIFTVDINNNASTILSTKLTIDNNENTSRTAATAAVISSSSISEDDIITIDIDVVGTGSPVGLIVTLIGTRTI